MISLRPGNANDFESLTELILSSAPILLAYLFGSEQKARDYILQSSKKDDGQYSAPRHQVATDGKGILGCLTLWDNDLPASFHQETLSSLSQFLTPVQLQHLLATNKQIEKVFLGPLDGQLCVGHLAVFDKYKGRGIGKKLIAYAIKQAKQRAKKQLILDVDCENKEALSFYQSLGFVVVASTTFAQTDQSFYRMHYQLQS